MQHLHFSSCWTASRYCWCSSTTSSRFYWPSSPRLSPAHSPSWLGVESPAAPCVKFVQLSPRKYLRFPPLPRVYSRDDSRYQPKQSSPILTRPRSVWRFRWSYWRASDNHRKLFWLCETAASIQVKVLTELACVDWLDARLRITKNCKII